MDEYLLDTNAASNILRGKGVNIVAKSRAILPARQYIPSVVRAEMLYGWQADPKLTLRIPELRRFLNGYPSLPFDDAAAERYGKLRAHLRAMGAMIGPNDLMIASIALAHDLVLVTHNTAEFARVPGLRLEGLAVRLRRHFKCLRHRGRRGKRLPPLTVILRIHPERDRDALPARLFRRPDTHATGNIRHVAGPVPSGGEGRLEDDGVPFHFNPATLRTFDSVPGARSSPRPPGITTMLGSVGCLNFR